MPKHGRNSLTLDETAVLVDLYYQSHSDEGDVWLDWLVSKCSRPMKLRSIMSKIGQAVVASYLKRPRLW